MCWQADAGLRPHLKEKPQNHITATAPQTQAKAAAPPHPLRPGRCGAASRVGPAVGRPGRAAGSRPDPLSPAGPGAERGAASSRSAPPLPPQAAAGRPLPARCKNRGRGFEAYTEAAGWGGAGRTHRSRRAAAGPGRAGPGRAGGGRREAQAGGGQGERPGNMAERGGGPPAPERPPPGRARPGGTGREGRAGDPRAEGLGVGRAVGGRDPAVAARYGAARCGGRLGTPPAVGVPL